MRSISALCLIHGEFVDQLGFPVPGLLEIELDGWLSGNALELVLVVSPLQQAAVTAALCDEEPGRSAADGPEIMLICHGGLRSAVSNALLRKGSTGAVMPKTNPSADNGLSRGEKDRSVSSLLGQGPFRYAALPLGRHHLRTCAEPPQSPEGDASNTGDASREAACPRIRPATDAPS